MPEPVTPPVPTAEPEPLPVPSWQASRGDQPGTALSNPSEAAGATAGGHRGHPSLAVTGADVGRIVAVRTRSTSVGRYKTCDVTLTDPSISRRHAEPRIAGDHVQPIDRLDQ